MIRCMKCMLTELIPITKYSSQQTFIILKIYDTL